MSQDSKSLYFPIRITSNLLLELSIELKDLLKDILNLLLAQLLNQFRFPDSNTMQNILQIHWFPSLHERLDIGANILMQLLFSLLMNGRAVSHSGIISDLSHSHVEILRTLMMLEVPVRSIRSVHMQLNADLEYLHGLLPIDVVVSNEGGHAPFEIMKSVLMVTTVTTSLLV